MPEMDYPVRCRWCGRVHDQARQEPVMRYADCTVWRCPDCGALVDDRPPSWGGSAIPVEGHPHCQGGVR